MKILLLSCSTGGGHNAAARALEEEFAARGCEVEFSDPFNWITSKTAAVVGNTYVRLVQRMPGLFGAVYGLGSLVDRLPGRSPVYWANKWASNYLRDYLERERPDAVVMTHLYPAEMITKLKQDGFPVPLSVYISTDYTCIPFVSETDCDYYVLPHEDLKAACLKRGMKIERLLPLGIPVGKKFLTPVPKEEARKMLSLPPKGRCMLLVGGSMGAGPLSQLTAGLAHFLQKQDRLIVVCGSNGPLYDKMKKQWGTHEKIRVLRWTDQMPEYFAACDVLYTKPGGLTSTEAAAAGLPMVHMNPIPGCETKNRRFFTLRGLSVSHRTISGQIHLGMRLLEDESFRERMRLRQRAILPHDAAGHICDFVTEEIRDE